MEVYPTPPCVQNHFNCVLNSFCLSALLSVSFTRASNLYFDMYSSVCLVVLLIKGSIYQPPLMAASNGLHMSECTNCSGCLAWEVVFRVKGHWVNLRWMQVSQLHFLVISAASATTFHKIFNALRQTCTKLCCINICISASCWVAWSVSICTSRQLSLTESVNWVDSGNWFKTRFSRNRASTWGAVAINLQWQFLRLTLLWFTHLSLTSFSMA
jgi:hypothetical protein